MEKKTKTITELPKRAKGLLALVLCFGLMFGNSLTVLAANRDADALKKGDVLEMGDILTSTDGDRTLSGGIELIYQDAQGNSQGKKHYGGGDVKNGVAKVGEGTSISSSKWEVVKDGERLHGNGCLTITLQAIPEEQKTPTGTTGGQNNSKDTQKQTLAPHTHSFEWTVTKEPTKTEDGLEEYKCRGCGAVEASQPISANMVKVKELYGLVKDAPKGGSVAYDFGDLSTISDYVLAKMAERNDVAVTVSFTYGGESHSITFPAGTDYAAVLTDADTMYGFYGAAAKLGLTVE